MAAHTKVAAAEISLGWPWRPPLSTVLMAAPSSQHRRGITRGDGATRGTVVQQSGSLVGASVVDTCISTVFDGGGAQMGSCRRVGTPSLLTSTTSSLDPPGSCMEAYSLKFDSRNPSGFGPPPARGRRGLG